MPDPDAPLADLIPPEAEEPLGTPPARQPFGSPYAIPLSTLVAGAAVSYHDQVIVQPETTSPLAASGGGIDGDSGD